MSIYATDAAGNRTKIAGVGLPGPTGKSAYQYAVEGGFTGTEDEFKALMGVRSNPNLLDNWYFADLINQRGKTEYSGGYGIDRWSSAKLVISDGYVSFQDNLIQSFEWERFAPLLGEKITLSYLNKDAVLTTATGSIPAEFNSNELQSVYFGPFIMYVFPGGSAQVFRIDRNDTIIAAKLELGPVQTLAHKDASGNWVLNDPPPNKALELAKCQRYQFVSTNDASYRHVGMGEAINTETLLISVSTPTTLRIFPTATLIGNLGFRSGATRFVASPPIATDTKGEGAVALNATLQGLTVGAVYDVWLEHNAQLILDANL